jgi:mono/diheme cytochrome c family protein
MTVVPQKLIRSVLPLVCIALLGIARGGRTPAQQKTPARNAAQQPQVTFNRDIAPIFYRACVSCHRPGEAGPFPLLTYADAKSHARQIAAVAKSRFMPPWLPEEGALKFADELRLPEDEIVRIQVWVEQDAEICRGLATRQAGRHCESDETLRLACEWLGQLLEFRLSHAR